MSAYRQSADHVPVEDAPSITAIMERAAIEGMRREVFAFTGRVANDEVLRRFFQASHVSERMRALQERHRETWTAYHEPRVAARREGWRLGRYYRRWLDEVPELRRRAGLGGLRIFLDGMRRRPVA